uniref:Aminotransferase-like plant mobile domain-containing protein n=1 Tax=Fagus sylvatica TaxID=28930 RepID=A0A2N9H6V3_FAGSY
MAFSKARNRSGTLAGEGDPPITGAPAVPRDRGDDSGDSSSGSGSPEPLEEVLGRPMVDPWYRSREWFPSVPANPQPPPVDWEWLVVREDAMADTNLGSCFPRDPRPANTKKEDFGSVPLIFDFQCSKAISWETWILRHCGSWCKDGVRLHTLFSLLTDPAEVELSPEELRIEAALANYIGRKNISLGNSSCEVYTLDGSLAYIPLGTCLGLYYKWIGSPYEATYKFATMPEESKVCWRPYRVTHRGFVYGSVMSGFRDVEAQDYTLIAEDTRVRRQFGFDQEVPAVMGVAAGEIPTINPFLKAKAFAYWSSVAPRVMILSGDRVGIYTTGISNYWRELMDCHGRAQKQWERRYLPFCCRHAFLPYLILYGEEGLFLLVPPLPKKGKSGRSKKREAPSKESPAKVSKKKKIVTAKAGGSRGVVIQEVVVQDPLPVEESAAQGVSAPMRSTLPELLQKKLKMKMLRLMQQETASDEEIVVAEVASDDEAIAIEASFWKKRVLWQRLLSDEHIAVGAVISAVMTAEAESIAITSSGGTVQNNPSKSDSHSDPSLFDSSPSTRHYVRRAWRGSIVSTDSKRTISATLVVPTPFSPPRESGGAASTPVVIATVVSAAIIVQEDETVPTATEETSSSEEVPVHISDILESNVVEDTQVDENLVVGTDFGTGVTQTGCAEAATSENPILADILPGSDISIVEGTFAQDPVDDISMEDMANAYDSYDVVLVGTGDHVAGTQATDLEVTAPAATHMSPTKTAAESSNEAVAEEGGWHQIAAVESATMGQPGLLSTTRSTTLGSSIFDDAKVEFHGFRVPRGGVQFLKALWKKYGSCSVYLKLGVYMGSSMLTLLCCVLAHMEHTKLKDASEVHILEWKAVVQEITREGFKFNFILDYLRRLAHDMFSKRILAELRAVEARAAALRDALNIIAPDPWDLASTRGVSIEPHVGSTLYGLLA